MIKLLIGFAVAVGVVYGMIVSKAFRIAMLIVAAVCVLGVWILLGDPFGLKNQAREAEAAQRVADCYRERHPEYRKRTKEELERDPFAELLDRDPACEALRDPVVRR